MLLHLVLFLVLLWACLKARKVSADWSDEEPIFDQARKLVARPIAVAMVFTIVAGYFIYGPLPSAPRDLFYLALLPPVIYLSSALTDPVERMGMYGLLILAGLFQLVQFGPDGSLLTRALLLASEVAAMAVMGSAAWHLRRSGDQPIASWRSRSVAIYAVLVLVFVVAPVANIFGWVQLAQFITEGMLLTCKGAVLAIIVFRAGKVLWHAFLRLKPGRAFLSVRRHTVLIERTGIVLLALLLLLMWTQQTLRRFRLSDPLANQLEAIWATPFPWAEVEITIGHVARALLILAATILGQRVLSFLLNEEIFPRLHIRESTTASFIKLLKYAIVAIGLAMAVSALGFTTTQLTVLFGALGVGIGFGLQNIVSNFVSGLILMFERPVKIGDVVEVGGNWGKIKEIGVRATSVMTFEGAEIVVPNADLISKEVKNWTLSDSAARIEVLVGVAYGTDAREVLEILIQSARDTEFVFTDPEPFAMMYGFGDSALNFRLLCWTSIETRGIVTNQVHIAVYEALNDAGIAIPFPQRDLNIKSADSALPLFDGHSDAD